MKISISAHYITWTIDIIFAAIAFFIAMWILDMVPSQEISFALLVSIVALSLSRLIGKGTTRVKFHFSSSGFRFRRDWLIALVYLLSILVVVSISPLNKEFYVNWPHISLLHYLRLGGAILLSAFLPGYVFLKSLNMKHRYSTLEEVLLSFFLSIFLTTLCYLIWAFFVPNWSNVNVLISFNVTVAILYIFKVLHTSRTRPTRYVGEIRIHEMVILGCILSIVSLGFALINQSNYPMYPGDQWRDHGAMLKFYKGELIESDFAGLYWYHAFLAAYYSLAGLPSINAFNSSFIFCLIIFLAFYTLSCSFFHPRSKVPITATLFTLFSGFGWIAFVYLRDIVQLDLISSLKLAAELTSDLWFPFVLLPRIVNVKIMIAIPAFLTLMFLMKRDDLPFRVQFVCSVIITSLGYLVHIWEIFTFIFLFTMYSFLQLLRGKFDRKHFLFSLSLSTGVLLAIGLDSLAPYRILTREITSALFAITAISFLLPLSVVPLKFVISAISSVITRVRKNVAKANPLDLFKRVSAIIVVYLYCLSFIILAIPEAKSPVAAVSGTVAWYYYPVKFGIIGLLCLAFVFFLNGWFRRVRFILFTVFGILLLISLQKFAIVLFPYVGVDLEYRLLTFLLFSGSILASILVVKSFSPNKHQRYYVRRLMIAPLMFLILVGGFSSTLLSLEWLIVKNYSFSESELQASKLAAELTGRSGALLTVSPHYSQQLLSFWGLSNDQIIADRDGYASVFFQPDEIETLFHTISKSGLRYVFLSSRDINELSQKGPSNSPLVSLLDYFPMILDKGGFKIFKVPQISPPSPSSKFGIIKPSPIKLFEDHFENEDITNSNWLGTYRVKNGELQIQRSSCTMGNLSVQDFILTLHVKIKKFGQEVQDVFQIMFNQQDPRHHLRLDIGRNDLFLWFCNKTQLTMLGSSRISVEEEVSYHIRLEVSGVHIGVYVEGEQKIDGRSPFEYTGGITFYANNSQVSLDNVCLSHIPPRLLSIVLPFLMVATSKHPYSIVPQGETLSFEYDSIVLPYDPLYGNMSKYLEWVRSGGTLIVLDSSGCGQFGSLFQVGMKSETKKVNGIEMEDRLVHLPEFEIQTISTWNETLFPIAFYANNSLRVSPYALKALIGEGQIIYIHVYPYFSQLQLASDSKRRLMTEKLSGLIGIIQGYGSGIKDKTEVHYFDFVEGHIHLEGKVQIKTHGLIIGVGKEILPQWFPKKIQDETLVSASHIKIQGSSQTVASFVPIFLYGNITITSSALKQAGESCQLNLSLLNDSLCILAESPEIENEGTSIFQRIWIFRKNYPSRSYPIWSNRELTIEGKTRFKLLYSDNEIRIISDFASQGLPLTPDKTISALWPGLWIDWKRLFFSHQNLILISIMALGILVLEIRGRKFS